MKFNFLSVAALCFTGPAALAIQVESLGSLPGGHYSPSYISQDGEVIAGLSDDVQNGTKVGLWTRATGLTILDQGTSAQFAPFGMSADGSMVVGDQLDFGPNLLRRPMLWDLTAGTRTNLGILPGYDSSNALSISSDGSTVVGSCSILNSYDYQAFRWTAAGGLQPLAPPVIMKPAYRNGISADGTVIVGSQVPAHDSFDSRAVVWSAANGLTSIPGLPDARSYATGVSDDGLHVVGVVQDPAFPSGVFYYHPGLGAFPVYLEGGSVNTGSPVLISADGSTVVAQAYVRGAQRAVKWSLGLGPHVLYEGGRSAAISISADGSSISGYAYPTSGSNTTQAFLWQDSGQATLLDPIEPGQDSNGFALSRDGSTVCGHGIVSGPNPQRQGSRWSADGEIGMGYCDQTVPNSLGFTAELLLTGSNVIDRGDLLLSARGLPGGTLALFLVSDNSSFVSGIPGIQGNLCLGGSIGRFTAPGQVQLTNVFGLVDLQVDPGNLPGPQGMFSASPGQSLYFQVYYRDRNPGNTTNFTSAGVVQFQ